MIQVTISEDLVTEPITLQDAKNWMQVDYTDYDDLITMLITAAREQSEKVSGQAYGLKTIKVTGNHKDERVYPIQPFVEDLTTDEHETTDYEYTAGFVTLPMDLKVAVLQRVATGFAYRQNGIEQAVNGVLNKSHNAELKYSYLYI
jgi:hypothetical protein